MTSTPTTYRTVEARELRVGDVFAGTFGAKDSDPIKKVDASHPGYVCVFFGRKGAKRPIFKPTQKVRIR